MKRLFFFILLPLLTSKISFSQEHNIHTVKYIFNPDADAKADIHSALTQAAKEHKHVLVLVGGDWNQSSITFDEMLKKGYIHECVDENYIFIKVNFSPGNKNQEALAQLESPKYEGYPVLIVLDETGKKIIAQNTDQFRTTPHNYSVQKILQALRTWACITSKN